MEEFLLGWSIIATILAILAIYLLFKKVSTTNNIEDQKINNKRNKGSNIDNDITSDIQETKRKRRRLNKLSTKK